MPEGKQVRYRPTYFGNKSVPAEQVYAELERLGRTEALSRRRVVEAARPANAVLHALFEWNNRVAAESWRDHQAGKVINSVEIYQPQRPEEPVVFRPAFYHIPNPNPGVAGSYVAREVLVENPDVFQRALTELLRNADGLERRVRDLRRLGEDQGKGKRILATLSAFYEGIHALRMGLTDIHGAI